MTETPLERLRQRLEVVTEALVDEGVTVHARLALAEEIDHLTASIERLERAAPAPPTPATDGVWIERESFLAAVWQGAARYLATEDCDKVTAMIRGML